MNPITITVNAQTEQAVAQLQQVTKQVETGLNRMTSAATGLNATAAVTRGNFVNLHRSATTTVQAFNSLRGVSLLLGMQVMPQVTTSVMTASYVMQGLRSAAILTGASFATIGAAAAGLAALLATATQGFKALAAAQKEAASVRALEAQDRYLADRLVPRLTSAIKRGLIEQRIGEALIGGLQNFSGSELNTLVHKAQAELLKVGAIDRQYQAKKEYEAFLQGVNVELLDGAAKAKAELTQKMDELLVKGIGLAKAAGVDDQPFVDTLNRLVEKGRAEIDKQEQQRQQEDLARVAQAMAQRRTTEQTTIAQVAELRAQLHLATLDGMVAETAAIDRRYDKELEGLADKNLALAEELDLVKQIGQAREAEKQRVEREQVQSDWRLSQAQKFGQLQALGGSGLGPNPNSFSDQLLAGFVRLQDQVGTFAQASADTLYNVFGRAVQGVSDAIMGAIEGTRTWGQVFADVGRSILANLVNLVVQWVANMTIIAALKRIFGIQDQAQAAASAAAWTPAAIAANTASYGAASAVGLSALLLAMGTATAAASALSTAGGIAGRAAGGPVQRGMPYVVGERRPELFVPSESGYIIPNVPSAMRNTAAESNSKQTVHQVAIGILDDRQDVLRWMESQAGKRIILTTIQNNRLEFGLQT